MKELGKFVLSGKSVARVGRLQLHNLTRVYM